MRVPCKIQFRRNTFLFLLYAKQYPTFFVFSLFSALRCVGRVIQHSTRIHGRAVRTIMINASLWVVNLSIYTQTKVNIKHIHTIFSLNIYVLIRILFVYLPENSLHSPVKYTKYSAKHCQQCDLGREAANKIQNIQSYLCEILFIMM